MSDGIARWKGRVAIVTGASAGIGRAIAKSLAECGMNVALAARRRDRIEALAAELGKNTLAVETDLRDEKSILALFEHVRQRFGGIDVLVNNAGLGHESSLTSGLTEHWREMLDVN